ncbi:MAG: T9SS type A sorting domain-containing protein [Balneolales bacterium]|nr:T9SS type A sorting domain-containing protein [Balneolales bacterium]
MIRFLQDTCTIKLLILAFIIFVFQQQGFAQYSSPGDGTTFTLEDLAEISGGVVVQDEDGFLINQDLIISATDVLEILSPALVRVEAGKRIEISGSLISDPDFGQVVFTAVDTTSAAANFRGFRFENAAPSKMINTVVKYGGGIQLIGSFAEFDSCVIRNNGTSNVTGGAITFSNTSPVINNCTFSENTSAAIGSGANVLGSPQITNSTFIANTMNNSNRPQINLGPGAAGDTLRIENNIIIGLNDNAGGIAVSNLLGSGTSLVSIRGNTIIGNRYGYAQTGNGISSVIEDNIIQDNNIQGQPNLGGSGLNFNASVPNTNLAVVRRNIISGNLWGVTIQGAANPSFGNQFDQGENVIYENGNGGITYALFNNTSNDINAIGNYWGENTEEFAESVIFHTPNDPNLGLVTYLPIKALNPEITEFSFLANENTALSEDVTGIIDSENATVVLSVPQGTNISNLMPFAPVPLGVESMPSLSEARDFTNPVSYTLSVPHEDTREWTVMVEEEFPPVFLQFVHISADPALGNIDVYVNGELAFEGLTFRNASPLLELQGAETIAVTATLAGDDAVIFEQELTPDAVEIPSSIVFSGLADDTGFAENPEGRNITLEAYEIPHIIPVNKIIAQVENFFHGVTDAPKVTVVKTSDFGSVSPGEFSYGDFVEFFYPAFDPDEYLLEIIDSEDGEVVASFTYNSDDLPEMYIFTLSGFLSPSENQNGAPLALHAVDIVTGEVTEIMVSTSTGPSTDVPLEFALEQNYPNPFNPVTNINFILPETGDVWLEVFNLQGQRVAVLVNGTRNAGSHTVQFNGSALASGLYVYRLSAGSFLQTRKMMLLK